MRVTPAAKKFGKYMPGDEFNLPDQVAKAFIKSGKLAAVGGVAPVYRTRMMQAAVPPVVAVARTAPPPSAPDTEVDASGATWDEHLHASTKAKNADGTWRKRPGPRSTDSGAEQE